MTAMRTQVANNKTKEHDANAKGGISNLLDDVSNLSDWGFKSSSCDLCGKMNSDIDGHLLQCSKCKKAYYCSYKCFKDAMPTHQQFCSTDNVIPADRPRQSVITKSLFDITPSSKECMDTESERHQKNDKEKKSDSGKKKGKKSSNDDPLDEVKKKKKKKAKAKTDGKNHKVKAKNEDSGGDAANRLSNNESNVSEPEKKKRSDSSSRRRSIASNSSVGTSNAATSNAEDSAADDESNSSYEYCVDVHVETERRQLELLEKNRKKNSNKKNDSNNDDNFGDSILLERNDNAMGEGTNVPAKNKPSNKTDNEHGESLSRNTDFQNIAENGSKVNVTLGSNNVASTNNNAGDDTTRNEESDEEYEESVVHVTREVNKFLNFGRKDPRHDKHVSEDCTNTHSINKGTSEEIPNQKNDEECDEEEYERVTKVDIVVTKFQNFSQKDPNNDNILGDNSHDPMDEVKKKKKKKKTKAKTDSKKRKVKAKKEDSSVDDANRSSKNESHVSQPEEKKGRDSSSRQRSIESNSSVGTSNAVTSNAEDSAADDESNSSYEYCVDVHVETERRQLELLEKNRKNSSQKNDSNNQDNFGDSKLLERKDNAIGEGTNVPTKHHNSKPSNKTDNQHGESLFQGTDFQNSGEKGSYEANVTPGSKNATSIKNNAREGTTRNEESDEEYEESVVHVTREVNKFLNFGQNDPRHDHVSGDCTNTHSINKGTFEAIPNQKNDEECDEEEYERVTKVDTVVTKFQNFGKKDPNNDNIADDYNNSHSINTKSSKRSLRKEGDDEEADEEDDESVTQETSREVTIRRIIGGNDLSTGICDEILLGETQRQESESKGNENPIAVCNNNDSFEYSEHIATTVSTKVEVKGNRAISRGSAQNEEDVEADMNKTGGIRGDRTNGIIVKPANVDSREIYSNKRSLDGPDASTKDTVQLRPVGLVNSKNGEWGKPELRLRKSFHKTSIDPSYDEMNDSIQYKSTDNDFDGMPEGALKQLEEKINFHNVGTDDKDKNLYNQIRSGAMKRANQSEGNEKKYEGQRPIRAHENPPEADGGHSARSVRLRSVGSIPPKAVEWPKPEWALAKHKSPTTFTSSNSGNDDLLIGNLSNEESQRSSTLGSPLTKLSSECKPEWVSRRSSLPCSLGQGPALDVNVSDDLLGRSMNVCDLQRGVSKNEKGTNNDSNQGLRLRRASTMEKTKSDYSWEPDWVKLRERILRKSNHALLHGSKNSSFSGGSNSSLDGDCHEDDIDSNILERRRSNMIISAAEKFLGKSERYCNRPRSDVSGGLGVSVLYNRSRLGAASERPSSVRRSSVFAVPGTTENELLKPIKISNNSIDVGHDVPERKRSTIKVAVAAKNDHPSLGLSERYGSTRFGNVSERLGKSERQNHRRLGVASERRLPARRSCFAVVEDTTEHKILGPSNIAGTIVDVEHDVRTRKQPSIKVSDTEKRDHLSLGVSERCGSSRFGNVSARLDMSERPTNRRLGAASERRSSVRRSCFAVVEGSSKNELLGSNQVPERRRSSIIVSVAEKDDDPSLGMSERVLGAASERRSSVHRRSFVLDDGTVVHENRMESIKVVESNKKEHTWEKPDWCKRSIKR